MRRRLGLAAIGLLLCISTGLSRQLPPWDPTARPVWRAPQATIGTPAISGDDVFALTADHQLLKVSLADGSERWRVGTGEHGVTHGHALALTSTSVLVGEYDIVAIDRVTGRRQWRFAPERGYAPGPYLGGVREGLAYAGSASGHLHAIDLQSGRARWTTTIDPDDDTTVYWPQVAGDEVVAGFTKHAPPGRGGLVALHADDGRLLWRFDFPPAEVGTPAAGGPVLAGDVIVAASGDGRIWAVDRRLGTVRWVLPPIAGELDSIVRPGDQDYRSLGMAGTTLVIGSVTGLIVGFDVVEQREVWRFAGGRLGSTAFRMTTSADGVFVPYVSGFLVALDGATGQLKWRTDDWRQGFIWPPALAGRIAVVSSREGLWALPVDREDRP